MASLAPGWQTEAEMRASLGLAPSTTNFFTDALGNAGPVTRSVTSSVTPKATKPVDWMFWLTVAGVGFAALTYFKGR